MKTIYVLILAIGLFLIGLALFAGETKQYYLGFILVAFAFACLYSAGRKLDRTQKYYQSRKTWEP